jgi:large subunit ribosomal protein L37Ae
MTRTAKVGQAGSLGSRYGTVARRRYAEIVGNLRKPSECPRCHITAVRRESVGVWLCGKCGYKFAGGAYVPQTKLGEVARHATRGGTQGIVATALGLVEKTKETAEIEKAKPRRRRARRKKAAGNQTESEAIN